MSECLKDGDGSIPIPAHEVSSGWKDRLRIGDVEYVPLDSIYNHPEDMKRIRNQRTNIARGVYLLNKKIEVDVVLPEPVVRKKK